MEAIAFTPPSPPPASQSTAGAQTGKAGDTSSFAPLLSHAISGRAKGQNHSSGKTLTKQQSSNQANTDTKQPTGSSSKQAPASHTTAKAKNTPSDTGSKNTGPAVTENTDTSPTDVKETKSDVKGTKPDELIAGLLGYLLGQTTALSATDLKKALKTIEDSLSNNGQKGILETLKNSLAALNDVSSGLPTDASEVTLSSDQLAGLAKLLQKLSSNFSSLQSGQSSSLQTDQSSSLTSSQSSSESTANAGQVPVLTKQDLQLIQQLQQVLSAVDAKASIVVQKPLANNQSSGLNTLSTPFFDISGKNQAAKSDIPAIPSVKITDRQEVAVSNSNEAMGLLANPAVQTGKTDGVQSVKPDQFLSQSFFQKVNDANQKNTMEMQNKDAGSQNTGSNRQTDPLSSLLATGNSNSILQPGQSLFGNTLTQTLQTGQGSTGINTTAHFSAWSAVQEHAIVNQVIQHLSVSPNSPTSRIAVKLYPEELGELKIDIQMTDGAVKANFVTQTQQVQQVIEKYIPKLKTLMEQQGLTVDDILVTNTSDNVADHHLFQGDFTDKNDFSPPNQRATSTPLTDLSFENTFSEKTGAASGVNVTV